jgi:hypothetical protein
MSVEFKDLAAADQDQIVKTIRQELEGEFIKRFEEQMTRQKEANSKAIQDALDEIKKKATPLTPAEIETALNQEYVQFKMTLPVNGESRSFDLVELPIKVEKKFYKLIIEKLQPRLKELADLEGDNLLSGTIEDKAKTIIALLDPSMELLCEVTAMVLDPFGKDQSITADWVSETLPAWRIWNIVMAQININRVRDFFSVAFQSSNSAMMISKANSQQ